MTAAHLYKRYPELFEVAHDLVEKARNSVQRKQSLWWDGTTWLRAPQGGTRCRKLQAAGAHLVGLYDCAAQPVEIVQDMLAMQTDQQKAAA